MTDNDIAANARALQAAALALRAKREEDPPPERLPERPTHFNRGAGTLDYRDPARPAPYLGGLALMQGSGPNGPRVRRTHRDGGMGSGSMAEAQAGTLRAAAAERRRLGLD